MSGDFQFKYPTQKRWRGEKGGGGGVGGSCKVEKLKIEKVPLDKTLKILSPQCQVRPRNEA